LPYTHLVMFEGTKEKLKEWLSSASFAPKVELFHSHIVLDDKESPTIVVYQRQGWA